ncbi:hypothetical protein OIU79_015853 [Salix purpurea]|uniref:Uncharacterized protein n=1 Tax=Salix purpurea TaxID=77065 RepID=A0A9Q0SR23_SALPP|nr:hypothetical protein OIU79_015853 [Salix purpurea]
MTRIVSGSTPVCSGNVKMAKKRASGPLTVQAQRLQIEKVPVSAHELHYTANKAVSENLKKKTFLPYKQGFFGRLAFNPAAHALGNGFGTSSR